MRKFTFFLTMLFATAMTAFAQDVTEYAHYEGTNNHVARALSTFTIVNLDTEATMTVDGIQSVGAKSPIYVDKTDNVFEVEPGNTLYFEQFGFAGEWMHAYAYIDYNNDFVFSTELNIDGDTEGELVSHNFYSPTDAEYGTTSRGQSVKNGNANNTNSYEGSQGLPHFTLPADLAAGDYRMRIKTDWNNLDPNFAGHTKQNEPKTIGACQVDFILRVAGAVEPEPEPEVPSVKWYRLKETSRNEYMNVVSYDPSYENNARGLVNIAPYAESNNQIFTMEDAGDGKVYLRTNNNYYLTCGAWNVNVSPDAKEALIFEETTIDGATAYFIHASSKEATQGFKIGGVNMGDGTYSDEYYVYCDAPQADWAYWVLEEATLVEEPVAPSYTATVDVNDAAMGSATVTLEGSVATFTATPNEGYKFAGWLMDGYDTGNVTNPLVFDIAEMGVTSLALVAKFEAIEGGETPEPSTDFEWASKTDVLIEAQGYYSQVLGTMYTLTADVVTEDATAYPASFDFGLGYYPGYDDGAGFVLPAYYYLAYYHDYYTNLSQYPSELVIAEDGKSAVLTPNASYNMLGNGRFLFTKNFTKEGINLTLNEDGTISMDDFIVSDADALEALATYTNVKLTKKADVVPTELTVKSYSPNKEVTSLETIEIEFSDAIATRISGSTGIVRPDGQTEYFMNREMDGKVLRLTLNPAQTAEGTYTLTIPAGVIKTAEGLEYAGGEFTFTVKQPTYLAVESIEPADKATVNVLNYIQFNFESYNTGFGPATEAATVVDKDGKLVETTLTYSYNHIDGTGLPYNAIGVIFGTAITTPGTYTVTIPEGAFKDFTNGDVNAKQVLTYTVEEAAEPEPPTSYAYYEGTNNHVGRALTTFTIADVDSDASLTVEGIQEVGAKSPIYVDKTDNVFEVKAGSTLYFEQFGFAGEWMHAYAYIDYNNDFVFGTDLNIDGDTEGELVSHNFYSATDAEWGTTSRGQEVKNGNANNTNSYEGSQGLPHFTLPADLAAGDYRMRIKTDWNNLDPNFAGHTKQNEPKTIGACQVDIIIRIVGDEPTPPAKEYVALVSETTLTVATLDAVVLVFDRWVQENAQSVDVKDADGKVVTTAAFGYKKPDGTTCGETELVLTLAEDITAAGTYTITLPENSVWDYVNGVAETTITITVDPTLGINGVEAEGEQVIYDITGRRIEKINAAGIYIVNGVKVLVK